MQNIAPEMYFSSPECSQRLREVLLALHWSGKVKLLAVDEAHCVSRWGKSFRHGYLQLD